MLPTVFSCIPDGQDSWPVLCLELLSISKGLGVGVGVGLCVVGQWDTPTEVHFMRQSLGKGAASETQDKL